MYGLYCLSKGGQINEWDYRGQQFFYICTIGGDIESSQEIIVKNRLNSSGRWPYEHLISYLSKESFSEFIKDKFVSDGVSIEKFGSNYFMISVNYVNKGNESVLFDFNDSKIQIDGKTYDVDFSHGEKNITWKYFYSANSAFYTAENQSGMKIKLNPGENFIAETTFEVAGIINENSNINSFMTKNQTFNRITFEKVIDSQFKKKKVGDDGKILDY